MKTLRLAVMMVLLVAPVHAQRLGTSIIPDTPAKTPEQIEQERVLEQNYKETLKKIPDVKSNSDPWGNVRSAGTLPSIKAAPAKMGGTSKLPANPQ